MSTSMVPRRGGEIVETDWNEVREQFIRRAYCGGAPAEVADLFIHLARRLDLSPEQRQIYLIRRGKDWVTVTGIDGYRLIAARTGEYAGCDVPEFDVGPDGKPVSAKVTVYRFVQREKCAFSAIAYWREFAPKPESGVWADKPFHMLAKVAEAHALRKAFPAELSGVYTPEEFDRGGDVVIDVAARPAADEAGATPALGGNDPVERDALMRKLHGWAHGLFGEQAHDVLREVARHAFGVAGLRETTDAQLRLMADGLTAYRGIDAVNRAREWLRRIAGAASDEELMGIARELRDATMPKPSRDILREAWAIRKAGLDAVADELGEPDEAPAQEPLIVDGETGEIEITSWAEAWERLKPYNVASLDDVASVLGIPKAEARALTPQQVVDLVINAD